MFRVTKKNLFSEKENFFVLDLKSKRLWIVLVAHTLRLRYANRLLLGRFTDQFHSDKYVILFFASVAYEIIDFWMDVSGFQHLVSERNLRFQI